MQVKKLGLVVTLGMIAVLMGCGGGTKTSTTPPPPTVTAITVTPSTNVISTTGSATFKAEANYSDGTQADITSTATWAASPAGIVTFSGSTATATAKGAVTITATSGSKSGSAVLNVTDLNLGTSSFTGTYAFQLQGIDTVGAGYAAGTITSDGNGNITGGEIDLNTASGVSAGTAPFNGSISSGTYSIGIDGRGTMSVTYNGTTIPFLVVISKDGSRGRLIESDGKATVAGTFEKQASTIAQPSGTSVFRLSGLELDSGGAQYMGEVGVMTVTGSSVTGFSDGNIRGGHNWAEQPVTGASLTAPDAHGRGTVSMTFAAGASLSSVITVDFAYYVVSANKFFLVSTDTGSGMELMAGQAETQTAPAPLTASDYTFLLDHAATPTTGTFEKTGRMTLSSLIVTSGSEAEDLSSNTVQDQSLQFDATSSTYTNPDANGRGMINTNVVASTGVTLLARDFVYYAVSANKAYMMETTCPSCSAGAFRAAIGELDGGGSAANLASGDYIFTSYELGEANMLQIGQLVSDGAGHLSGVVDIVNHAGASNMQISEAAVGSTSLGSVPASLCLTACPFESSFTPSNITSLSVINYLVYGKSDGTGAVLLGYNPDIDGYIDLQ